MLGDPQVWVKAQRTTYVHEVHANSADRAKIGSFLSQRGVRKRDYTLKRDEPRVFQPLLPGWVKGMKPGTLSVVSARVRFWNSARDLYRFKKAEHAVLLRLVLDENGGLT